MIKLVLKDFGGGVRLIIKDNSSIMQCTMDLPYCVGEVEKNWRSLWLDSWKPWKGCSPAPPFMVRFLILILIMQVCHEKFTKKKNNSAITN